MKAIKIYYKPLSIISLHHLNQIEINNLKKNINKQIKEINNWIKQEINQYNEDSIPYLCLTLKKLKSVMIENQGMIEWIKENIDESNDNFDKDYWNSLLIDYEYLDSLEKLIANDYPQYKLLILKYDLFIEKVNKKQHDFINSNSFYQINIVQLFDEIFDLKDKQILKEIYPIFSKTNLKQLEYDWFKELIENSNLNQDALNHSGDLEKIYLV